MSADEEGMAAAILKFVQENPGASFVNLCRSIDGFAGDYEFGPGGCANLLYWSGVSKDGALALTGLIGDKKLHYKPTSVMIYLIDGANPDLPIAKRLTSYKTPHWLPVTLHLTKPAIHPPKVKAKRS